MARKVKIAPKVQGRKSLALDPNMLVAKGKKHVHKSALTQPTMLPSQATP